MYLGVSIVLLYPVLAAPVMADDLFNPYSQFDVAGPGIAAAVDFGWSASTQGGSFRILGTVTGAVYNWLWLSTAAWFGLDPAAFFAITKYVVFVLCAAAIGWCWCGLSEYCSRSIRFRTAFVWVSFVLFSTVQIHALWSNDPVASYPLAGYGAAALGFVLIGSAARLAQRRSPRSIVLTALCAGAAVLYYELNIGAVMASFGLLAVSWWQARRERRPGAGSIAVAGLAGGRSAGSTGAVRPNRHRRAVDRVRGHNDPTVGCCRHLRTWCDHVPARRGMAAVQRCSRWPGGVGVLRVRYDGVVSLRRLVVVDVG